MIEIWFYPRAVDRRRLGDQLITTKCNQVIVGTASSRLFEIVGGKHNGVLISPSSLRCVIPNDPGPGAILVKETEEVQIATD